MQIAVTTEKDCFQNTANFNQRYLPMDREGFGPEFDDRLIKLVKENAAIYDVSHPHYRRTPVRMAIWDNIAKELGAPSRFLQTKWKNIRYNYLQEQKCLETGIINTNIRKRRFTEDLSFLKYTAYRRDGPIPTKHNNESDDNSNSYTYPDNLCATNTYEVIELDQSDEEETKEYVTDVSAFLAPMKDIAQSSPPDPYGQPDNPEEISEITLKFYKKQDASPKEAIQESTKDLLTKRSVTPTDSHDSNRSSPLLTPIVTTAADTKNESQMKCIANGNSQLYSEVTIQALPPASNKKRMLSVVPADHIMTNSAKRKSASVLAPISDPIELYCLSLVDCFRAMPRSERERVKFEFAKILKDAQYIDQS